VRHSSLLGAGATLLALVAAGCGSSGSSTTKTTAASASSSASQAAPAPATTASGATSTSASASTGAVLISTKQDKLGTILAAGSKRMTVYLFEGDKRAGSACTGACTHVWPPVTTTGQAKSGGGAMAADLGTIMRSDGTRQVTYKGHPLYFFARDGDKGDAYGQGVKGFGASWYVLSPSGSKVDKS
jgi:predicted lipoprotein with Yx(FWY)xxD motif